MAFGILRQRISRGKCAKTCKAYRQFRGNSEARQVLVLAGMGLRAVQDFLRSDNILEVRVWHFVLRLEFIVHCTSLFYWN
jgi:hypothetical protein